MTKVAIVEDNATLRKYLAELIGHTPGHKCVCACASAEEAVVEIPKHRPNVVLMDIHLPGESGIACTARLREKMPDLQVIMLTVYKDIKTIFQALKAGAPMTSEIARMVVRAFEDSPPLAAAEGTDQLSTREMGILALLAEGCPNKEIASRLSISTATVRTHLMHIYEKLHVHCRTEAAAKYLRTNSASVAKQTAVHSVS